MPRRPPVSRRRKPHQDRAQATCEAILTAAARVLVKNGYEAASTNRIAREAGVSIGSLYQYFPSKEGLVMAVMERHRTRSLAGFEAELVRLASQPLPQAIRALVRQLLTTKLENPRLHQVLHELAPRMRQLGQVDPHEQRLFRLVRAFLAPRAEELRPKDLDMAVFVLVHSVETLCIKAVADRPDYLTNEAFLDELCALMQGYLQPAGATSRATPKKKMMTGRGRSPASREFSARP
ncbi:TetR/AcrR family transcriptional regulator [Myxococcus sp. CA040A]|uniref:TetR/AcrR family transcriptional regulator n=1 Tax=Myxococcus sp. CA040A TaxID=2741738 RepID=UPI00157B11BE|nr:TetR/AcrR family transcriptional regulator [Myxococcus sp. CA040A]NTX07538.1 TetR family transcriptional regulator [Myxococcus sp. CA040A]